MSSSDSVSPVAYIGGGILVLGLLALAILQLVGLGYLTSVSFGNKKFEDLTTTQRNLCRLAVVLLWISLVAGVLNYFITKASQ